jgi:hypothetical protein
MLNNQVYSNNPHTEDYQKRKNIQDIEPSISPEEIQHIMNMSVRFDVCQPKETISSTFFKYGE